MNFPEAHAILLAGGRVRRKLWAACDGKVGCWLEMVPGPLADGRPLAAPLPLVWTDSGFVSWAGALNDVFADDWERA